ncbi:hypothetical protein [Roseibium sp. MMSF_3544]|uniref:hypothetical protein n=1 Tax=unclassified Roseibium TaxID=2629323 RepID=UPI00273EFA92|nr:hypothetical protein [Roseibium sp. MMSF_3544]
MRKRQAPALGVLRLDYDYPPALGDVDDPDSFSYDVLYKVVPGLTFSMCQSGELTEDVTNAVVDSVRFLNSYHVNAITGDCGFMLNIQDLVKDHSDVPVFMSCLVQLPTIINTINSEAEIAIFTANSTSLAQIETELDRMSGLQEHSHRLQIVGCQDVPGFEAVAKGQRVDTEKVGKGLIGLTNTVLRNKPKIECLLLECTELPPYANLLRSVTGLPVYDAITNCDFFMNGFLDNKNFGVHDWQESWDGNREAYEFGDNLSSFERAQLDGGNSKK